MTCDIGRVRKSVGQDTPSAALRVGVSVVNRDHNAVLPCAVAIRAPAAAGATG
jgi:hypothetical protein